MKRQSHLHVALVGVLLLILSACGGSEETSDASTAAADSTEAGEGGDTGAETGEADATDEIETTATDDTPADATEDEQAQAADGEPIPIGVLFAQTGAISGLGVSARFGALSAVDYVNAQGGVDGRPLEADFCDDGGDEARAVTCVRQFVDSGVVGIVGPITSPLGLATSPISQQAGIPQLALGSATGLTDPVVPNLFRVSSGTEEEYEIVKAYIDEQGFERVALLHDNNAFGQDAAAIATRMMGELGVEIVETESFETTDTDMTAQLTSIGGTDAEAIILPATVQGGAVAVRNHAALGLDIPIITGSGLQSDAFVGLAGDLAEGVVRLTGWKVTVFDTLSPDDPLYDSIDLFLNNYNGDTRPDPFNALGWDAVLLLTEAMRAAEDVDDPASIRDALENDVIMVGAGSTWDYAPDNHRGNDSSGLFMAELVDGNWVALE